MNSVADDARSEPPLRGDEITTLLAFLDYQRATLAGKCGNLDSAGLNTAVAPSTMTLGGLLKHLACVEEWWFHQVLRGAAATPPWDTVDWESDRDWDWHSAARDHPEALRLLWHDTVVQSRADVAQALREAGLSQVALGVPGDREAPSLRWIVCHMIEEYARHNGHADLIREAIDGQTGE